MAKGKMDWDGKDCPVYRFGPFELDTGKRLLLKNGKPHYLSPRLYGVLRLLLNAAGRIVTKDELLHEVWADAFVASS